MTDPVLNTDPSADLFFPLASQPDIVRASQKDEYYKRVLYDKYYEIVQRIMGKKDLLKKIINSYIILLFYIIILK